MFKAILWFNSVSFGS